MNSSKLLASIHIPLLMLALGGCASLASDPDTATKPRFSRADLACTLPTNCVNSLDGSSLSPLRFEGTPGQGLARLRETLVDFPEAFIVDGDALHLEVTFTTTIGFRDRVDFVIDPDAQRIDFRSRSKLGLFDFGKNSSRMREFSSAFERRRDPSAE